MATAAELALILRTQDRMTKDLARARKELDRFKKTSKSMKIDLSGLGKALGGIAGGATVTMLAKTGFAYNMMQENAALAFKTLLGGDATRAAEFMRQLQTFSTTTSVPLGELTEAAQKMLTFGFSAEQVIPLLRDIGDAVGAVGGGAELVGRVSTALGQMKTKGKASAEEMMQLAEAGIPAWQMLKDNIDQVFGTQRANQLRAGRDRMIQSLIEKAGLGPEGQQLMTVAQATAIADQKLIESIMDLVTAGKLTADKAIAAIQKGMRDRFGGLAAEQMNTMSGKLASLRSAWEQMLASFTGSAMDPAREGIGMLTEMLRGFTTTAQSWPPALRQVVGTIVGVGSVLGGMLGDNGGLGSLAGLLGGGGGMMPMLLVALAIVAAIAALFVGPQVIRTLFEGATTAAQRILDWLSGAENDPGGGGGGGGGGFPISLLFTHPVGVAVAAWVFGTGTLIRALEITFLWQTGGVAQWVVSGADLTRTLAVTFAPVTVGLAVAAWIADATGLTRALGVSFTFPQTDAVAKWVSESATLDRTVQVAIAFVTAGLPAAAWVVAGTELARTISTRLEMVGSVWATLGDWVGAGNAITRSINTRLDMVGSVWTTLGDWIGAGIAITRSIDTRLNMVGNVWEALGDWIGADRPVTRTVNTRFDLVGAVWETLGSWLGWGINLTRTIDTRLEMVGYYWTDTALGHWIATGNNITRTIWGRIEMVGSVWAVLGNWIGAAIPLSRNLNASLGLEGPTWLKSWLENGDSKPSRVLSVFLEAAANDFWTRVGSWITDGNTLHRTINVAFSGAVDNVTRTINTRLEMVGNVWAALGEWIGANRELTRSVGVQFNATPTTLWNQIGPQLQGLAPWTRAVSIDFQKNSASTPTSTIWDWLTGNGTLTRSVWLTFPGTGGATAMTAQSVVSAMDRAPDGGAMPGQSRSSLSAGGGGGTVYNVTVNVAGTVLTQTDLVDAVIDGIRRKQLSNGSVFAT